jgi:class 3 adenylate cyclase
MEKDEKKELGNKLIREPETEIENVEKAKNLGVSLANNIKNRKTINSPLNDPTQSFLHDFWLANKNINFYSSFVSVDLRGFTTLSYEKKPNEIAEVVSIFSNFVGSVTSISGGYVLKFLGDGAISFFPSIEHKRSVKRALLASYAISKGMKELIKYFNELELGKIDFGIGCDFGASVVIKIGSPYSKIHYDLIGKPINLSVKLQKFSENGDILTTENVKNNCPDELSTAFKNFELKENTHPSGFIGWLIKSADFFRSRKPEKLYVFDPD